MTKTQRREWGKDRRNPSHSHGRIARHLESAHRAAFPFDLYFCKRTDVNTPHSHTPRKTYSYTALSQTQTQSSSSTSPGSSSREAWSSAPRRSISGARSGGHGLLELGLVRGDLVRVRVRDRVRVRVGLRVGVRVRVRVRVRVGALSEATLSESALEMISSATMRPDLMVVRGRGRVSLGEIRVRFGPD